MVPNVKGGWGGGGRWSRGMGWKGVYVSMTQRPKPEGATASVTNTQATSVDVVFVYFVHIST